MWYIRVVSGPAEEPLTLAETKLHCRVDYDEEDTLIESEIVAARQQVELDTSRALITQQLELGLDDFPSCEDRIRIPRGNLQTIDSFTYLDTALVSHSLVADTDYLVNQYAEPAEVVLPWDHIWPSLVLSTAAPVKIKFTAGWATADDVPRRLKQAMLMLIGDWFNNREDVVIGRTSAVATRLANGYNRLIGTYCIRNYTPY
jgi:uncharacterized phiE125 gp8 family phage protein